MILLFVLFRDFLGMWKREGIENEPPVSFENCLNIYIILFILVLLSLSQVHLLHYYRDEELLGQALDLNDRMQILLGKHDAIASGSPLPDEETDIMNESSAETTSTPVATGAPRAAVAAIVPTNVFDEEEEDEDDELSQLARRLF